MSASRKTLTEKIRAKALELHRKNGCTKPWPCFGPTQTEWEQATKAVMRADKKADAS